MKKTTSVILKSDHMKSQYEKSVKNRLKNSKYVLERVYFEFEKGGDSVKPTTPLDTPLKLQ